MKSVLVIDDDPAMRAILRLFLEAGGYGVADAGDGQEGLARLGGGGVDLVVLDLLMPGMDGLEVMARIRELDLTVKVLLVSAYTPGSDAPMPGCDAGFGADAVLTKPVTETRLLDQVGELIGAP